MDKTILEELIKKGLSIAKIAKETKKGKTTVSYWLKKHNLKTIYTNGNNIELTEIRCSKCNIIKTVDNFYKKKNKRFMAYCKTCRHKIALDLQRSTKQKVIEYLGGECKICGYKKCAAALHIHHTIPDLKSKDFVKFKYKKFDERYKKELETCELLCANCHAEIHSLEFNK